MTSWVCAIASCQALWLTVLTLSPPHRVWDGMPVTQKEPGDARPSLSALRLSSGVRAERQVSSLAGTRWSYGGWRWRPVLRTVPSDLATRLTARRVPGDGTPLHAGRRAAAPGGGPMIIRSR